MESVALSGWSYVPSLNNVWCEGAALVGGFVHNNFVSRGSKRALIEVKFAI